MNSTLLQHTIEHSASLNDAKTSLMAEFKAWIYDCIEEYEHLDPSNSHDQATYTISWGPYLRESRDQRVLDYLLHLEAKISQHFVNNGMWQYGYWREQEAHHGTEHYELFLGFLWGLHKDGLYSDAEMAGVKSRIHDAAMHIGDWDTRSPSWFNWQTGRFHSYFLGTEIVKQEPGHEVNLADTIRLVNIALLAYDMHKEDRFLELARCHADQWANAISADAIPLGLTPSGALYAEDSDQVDAKHMSVGQATFMHGRNLDMAECLVASDGPNMFLRLWQITHDDTYKETAAHILDAMLAELTSPTGAVFAKGLYDYDEITQEGRYTQALKDLGHNVDTLTSIALDPEVPRDTRPEGLGTRQDMPDWFTDELPSAYHPVSQAIAAKVTNDDNLARQALDYCRARFTLARQAYPHGRHHGCSSRTVSAICRGHGRENNVGIITGALSLYV